MNLDINTATQIGLAVGTMLVVAYNTFQGGRIRAKVRQVQSTQVETNKETDRKLAVIHALGNSAMGLQKKLAAELAEEVAALTRKAEHLQRARLLRAVYTEYMRQAAEAEQIEDNLPVY